MQEIMTTIELSGILGKTFGKTHQRLISTTQEAAKSLAATLPGFEKFMLTSKRRGLTYAIFRGKKNLKAEELEFPVNNEVVRIVPVIIGSKRAGALQTILGAALVAVGAFGAFTPWGQAIGGAAWGPALMQAGAAMAVGGVIQLLSPQTAGLASKQDSANKASYAFGSPTNTASQGYPVGLLYGQRRIGGAIISAGIYVEDQQ